MKIKINLILFLSGCLIPILTNGQIAITAVPFLQIEPDSRSAAMGNTGVAIADNASAIFWNPAGLAFQTGNQISFTHTNWLKNFNVNDLFYDYLAGKMEIDGLGTFGGHITFLNLGEQAKTSSDGPDVISKFKSYEVALGLSYAYKINKNFALGNSLRFIFSSLASVTEVGVDVDAQKVNPASSVALDIAALYKSDPFMLAGNEAKINVGLNLSNIGTKMQYVDNAQKDPLPTVLRFGFAVDYELDPDGFNRITLATDISKIMARTKEKIIEFTEDTLITERVASGPIKALFDSWGTWTYNNGEKDIELSLLEQFMIGTGIEYWYNNIFALRGGYYYEDPNNGDRQYITFGAGLKYNKLGVDFSYIKTLESDHPLANTLRLGVLYDF